jgi:hypothetical protein
VPDEGLVGQEREKKGAQLSRRVGGGIDRGRAGPRLTQAGLVTAYQATHGLASLDHALFVD